MVLPRKLVSREAKGFSAFPAYPIGLSISSAIVATYGELAVDVFYVRDGFGHKIVNPNRLADIEARLMKTLESGNLMPA